jgi:GNAT superfamily N-acetyltransferase
MTTMPTIRVATTADARAVSEFGRRVFYEAFAAQNTAEDMAAYLAASFGEDRQAAEIADRDAVTLLAEADATILAYAQLRRSSPPACVSGSDPVELVRFYVDRDWQGRGVAQALMQATDAAASTLGRTIWLGVWEHNLRAIAFYVKCGFVDIGSHEFRLGQDRQTDRIMSRAVISGAARTSG